MTTDELKKETEENSFRYTLDKPWVCEVERKQIMAHFEKGYLASAEPREKRVVETQELKKEVKEYISHEPTEGAKDFIVYKIKVGENAFSYVVEHKNELSLSDWVKIYEGTEQECYRVVGYLDSAKPREKRIAELEQENAELRKIAEFQQSSNMNTHLENKKLKEGLAVGSTWNKYLNSMNKSLEEERDKYREMTFDMKDQLTKAKEIITVFLKYSEYDEFEQKEFDEYFDNKNKAEQFLSEVEK